MCVNVWRLWQFKTYTTLKSEKFAALIHNLLPLLSISRKLYVLVHQSDSKLCPKSVQRCEQWRVLFIVRGPGGETLPPSGEFWGHISFWSIAWGCFKSGCSHFSSGGVWPYGHTLYVRQKKTIGYPRRGFWKLHLKCPDKTHNTIKCVGISIKITYIILSK